MLKLSIDLTPEQLSNSALLNELSNVMQKFVKPVQAAAVQQTAPTPSALTVPQQAAPVSITVPVAQSLFTHQGLATAAMQLRDLNRIQDMQNLLSEFGVVAITQLQESQLPAFAQRLQELGVKL